MIFWIAESDAPSGAIQFTTVGMNVTEKSNVTEVLIERLAGANYTLGPIFDGAQNRSFVLEPVVVFLTAEDGTATNTVMNEEGGDYTFGLPEIPSLNIELPAAPNGSVHSAFTTANATVTIVDDGDMELQEYFTMELHPSDDLRPVEFGARTTLTVYIDRSDGADGIVQFVNSTTLVTAEVCCVWVQGSWSKLIRACATMTASGFPRHSPPRMPILPFL